MNHSELIQILKQLGYTLDSKGMCYGFNAMSLFAFLLEDIETFSFRLKKMSLLKRFFDRYPQVFPEGFASWEKQLITNYQTGRLPEVTSSVIPSSTGSNLINSVLLNICDLTDIKAFCDGLIVIQSNSSRYSHLIEDTKYLNQNLTLFIFLLLAKKFETLNEGARDFPIQVCKFSYICNQQELTDFLQKLIIAIEAQPEQSNAPISLFFRGHRHVMHIGYYPKNKLWYCFPINHPHGIIFNTPSTQNAAALTLAELVDHSFASFSIAFLVEVYTKSSSFESVKQITQNWRQSLPLPNEDRATRIAYGNKSWLTQAIKNNETELVLSLFSLNAHPNQMIGSSHIIFYFYYRKQFELVNMLLTKIHLNIMRDSQQRTLLILAASLGDIATVRNILKLGTDVNAHDISGFTALCAASSNGHLRIVQELILHGKDIHKSLKESLVCPLNTACTLAKIEVAEELLKQNYDTTASDSEGWTLLHNVCLSGNPKIFSLVLPYITDIDQVNNDGDTAFFIACQNGHIELVKLFFKTIFDINKRCDRGDTALHFACKINYLLLIELLIKNGADIYQLNDDNLSSLEIAKRGSNAEIIAFLTTKDLELKASKISGNSFFYKSSSATNKHMFIPLPSFRAP